MVKITAVNTKRKGKISPTQLFAVLGTLGCIVYYATLQPDDTSLGNLLNINLQTSPEAVYKIVSESVSSVASSSSGGAATSRTATVGTTMSGSITSNQNHVYTPSSTSGLQPVKCQDLFTEGYRQSGESQASDAELNPNNDQIHARFTKNFTSKFWVSVHHETVDALQYSSIMDTGIYNKMAMNQAALEIIASADSNARVLDVGAQVGWFSLLARGLGVEVDAFEPLRPNLFRLCESLHLNRWSNFVEHAYPGPYMNLHAVAVSDEEQDAFRMKQTGASASINVGDKEISVKTTTLDAFVSGRGWTTENVCLLKVNTMGMEDKVLAGAKSLLASKMVKHILIGLSSSGSNAAVQTLLSAGYQLHKWGGANGPDQTAAWSSIPTDDAGSLMSAVAAKVPSGEQVFLWFSL
jgi:FkbM family methyltransferase